MGFLGIEEQPKKRSAVQKELPLELLHKMGCKACPLNLIKGNRHPHMEATGSEEPLIYMLGEAPGKQEDMKGRQFVGEAGSTLRFRIPKEWDDDNLRWNNTVRTRPPDNRTPTKVEVECCRPSVEDDIAWSKPDAIFGFGGIPLGMVLGQIGITKWNGRMIPVNIKGHKCWYFPMLHPSYVSRGLKFKHRDIKRFASDNEFVFHWDLQQAFAAVKRGLPEPIVHTREDAERDVEWVTGEQPGDLQRVLDAIQAAWDVPSAGFDYETNGLRPYKKGAKILTVAIATSERSFAFPIYHREAGWNEKELDIIWKALEDWLYDAPCRKLVHHLPFEMEWSAYFFGRDVLRSGKWADSLVQAYILDERMGKGKPGCHALEFLSIQYFGLNVKTLSNVNRKNVDGEPLEKVLKYNGIDAKYHKLLYHAQLKRLKAEGLLDLYQRHMPRIPTMVLTSMKGIPIHQPTVRKFHDKYLAERNKVEGKIAHHEVIREWEDREGDEFRPSANADVKKLLHHLGIHDFKNVDEDTLKEVKHPIAKLLIAWRKANKNLTTYVYPVVSEETVKAIHKDTPLAEVVASPHIWPGGIAHPITTTTKTRTWRTASEDFNYQNWPKRQTKEMRSQVRVKKGFKLVSFDYGQIQARNVGMESLDKALIQSFWDRSDIHHDWTERIIKRVPRWMDEKGGEEVVRADKALWKWYRDRTKNEFVFPSFFGAMPKGLAGYLEISEQITEELHEEFWAMFPHIKDWHKQLAKDYYKRGYVTGLTGFRRRAPIAMNQLINAPIQSDEAAIVCDAMNRLSEMGWEYQANMEIHDDLTFIWPEDRVEERAKVVVGAMVDVPFEWAKVVPIVVEMSIGDDWADKKDVGVYASDTYKGDLALDDKKRDEVGLGSWDDGTGWQNAHHYEKPNPRKQHFDEQRAR